MSELQSQVSELLSVFLGHCTIRENYRPQWLDGLELDFFIEELDAAIEVQGRQHYEWIKYFHPAYDDFLAQQERDRLKKEICRQHGVRLEYVYERPDAVRIVEELQGQDIPYPLHPNYIALCEDIREETEKSKTSAKLSKQKRKIIERLIHRVKRLQVQIECTLANGNDTGNFYEGLANYKKRIKNHLVGVYPAEKVDSFIESL